MEKSIRLWEPVVKSFKGAYPDFYEQMVDWYPNGYLEIMVKLQDGRRLTYELIGDFIRFVRDTDYRVDELNEDIWRKNFSKCLKDRMRKLGLNQDELSERTGISRMTLSKYMNGKASPSGYNLERLARALKSSISELTSIR